MKAPKWVRFEDRHSILNSAIHPELGSSAAVTDPRHPYALTRLSKRDPSILSFYTNHPSTSAPNADLVLDLDGRGEGENWGLIGTFHLTTLRLRCGLNVLP